jgi:hypothetical protein
VPRGTSVHPAAALKLLPAAEIGTMVSIPVSGVRALTIFRSEKTKIPKRIAIPTGKIFLFCIVELWFLRFRSMGMTDECHHKIWGCDEASAKLVGCPDAGMTNLVLSG